MGKPPVVNRIAKASLLLFLLAMFGRFLGFLQQVVIAHEFGVSESLDAFLIAQSLPNFFLRIMMVGTIGASFIPIFKKLESEGRKEEGWVLVNSLLNVTLLALVVLGVGVFFLSKPLTTLFAPGFVGERFELAATLAQALVVIIPFAGVTAILRSVGNMQRDYTYPAIAALVGSFVNVAVTWWLARWMGINALVVATIAMTVTVAALTFFFEKKKGYRYQFVIRFRSAAESNVLKSLSAIAVITIMNTINFYASRWFASLLPEGQVSVLTYAWRFEPIIVGGIGSAVAAPLLTELAESLAVKDQVGARAKIIAALRVVSLLVVPVCVTLFAFSREFISMVFAHGSFTALDAQEVSAVLSVVLGALFIWAYGTILNQYFFASQRWKISAWITTTNIIIIIAISAFVYKPYGVVGLAWATTGSTWFFAIVGWWIVTKEMGNFWKDLRGFGVRILGAAAVMVICGKIFIAVLAPLFESARLTTFVSLGVAASVYAVLCVVLRIDEARALANKVKSLIAAPANLG